MIRPILLALLLAALPGVAPALPADGLKRLNLEAVAPGTGSDPMSVLARVRRHLDAEEPDAARGLLDGLLADPAFPEWDERLRVGVHGLSGWTAMFQGDHAHAYEQALALTRLSLAPADAWDLLARAAVLTDRDDAAAAALAERLGRFPDSADFPDELAGSVIFNAGRGAPGRRRLLEALFAADRTLGETGDGSHLWYELALYQLADGDAAGAAASIARVSDPTVRVRIAMDRRFDAIAPPPGPADLRDAAEAHESRLRTRAVLAPDVVEIQAALAETLLALGDADAVVALVDAAGDADEYADGEDQLPWLRNTRVRALLQLGRRDEALAAQRALADASRDSDDPVSHVLNLASLQTRLEQPDAALATIEGVDDGLSVYGRLVRADVRHRAALQRGDAAAATAAREELRAQGQDFPQFLVGALLDAGRVDEAAGATIAALADPDRRVEALYLLQKFRTSPPLPGDIAPRAALQALREREDVRAAVDTVGRILDVPLHD